MKRILITILLLIGLAMPVGASAEAAFTKPVHGCWISSYFSSWHPGVDLACDYGTPVYAAKHGWVTFAGWDWTGYGNMIDLYDGIDLTRYAHLSEIWVTWGQEVQKGDRIGTVGSSGHSTGPHLHFEVYWGTMPVNPLLPIPNL